MAGKVLNFTNGFPGQISRSIDDIVGAYANGEASSPIAIGAPVALDGGNVVNVSATKTKVIGVAVRNPKTEKTYAGNDPEYGAKEMVDVLLRGSVTVLVPTGTPAPGGKVYIVKATGAFATAADGDNTIEMADWVFKSGVDSNKIAEITLTKRNY